MHLYRWDIDILFRKSIEISHSFWHFLTLRPQLNCPSRSSSYLLALFQTSPIPTVTFGSSTITLSLCRSSFSLQVPQLNVTYSSFTDPCSEKNALNFCFIIYQCLSPFSTLQSTIHSWHSCILGVHSNLVILHSSAMASAIKCSWSLQLSIVFWTISSLSLWQRVSIYWSLWRFYDRKDAWNNKIRGRRISKW